ncbi:P-II family nitrogen regulator [Reichenbachiella sp.]|uniref:P-II family nitrogen regulator n=1 Tax=Reichenbachiella sp. TaxID=2184521 RepID=UPI003BAF7349
MELQKLEIIISNTYLEQLVDHLEDIGVNGYTALEIFRGKGIRTGEHLSEGLLPTTRNTLIICLVTEDVVEEIFEDLKVYINERNGVLFTVPILRHMGINNKI